MSEHPRITLDYVLAAHEGALERVELAAGLLMALQHKLPTREEVLEDLDSHTHDIKHRVVLITGPHAYEHFECSGDYHVLSPDEPCSPLDAIAILQAAAVLAEVGTIPVVVRLDMLRLPADYLAKIPPQYAEILRDRAIIATDPPWGETRGQIQRYELWPSEFNFVTLDRIELLARIIDEWHTPVIISAARWTA